jgi:outer membrane protein assembly factor BamA
MGGRGTTRRNSGRVASVLFIAVLAWGAGPCRGQYLLEDKDQPHRYDTGPVVLPFGFYSLTYGLGGGVVLFGNGLIQKQSGTFAYALGSSNGTYGGAFGEDDLQLNPVSRLFLDSRFGYILDRDYKAFVNGNRRFRGEAAGTNDSSEKDYFVDQAGDVFAHLTFRYLLPIGGGRDTIINRYVLKDGLLVSGATGGRGWNPFKTGRTYVHVTPFVEDIALDTPKERRRHDRLHTDENGVRFGLIYDNTDFPLNPSSGNITKATVSRDFGWFESSQAWTNFTGEFSQFFDLGRSRFFRQQVLAFDFWTSYSMTWDETIHNGVRNLRQAPPFFDGATLGGSERLRAFAENRFWDRAAGYGSVELRVIPDWNPLGRIKILRPADITWMQWVVFAEAGRVSEEYSVDLLKHLKGDVGFGLRLLSNDTLVRLDIAASHEGITVVAQLSQPF